MKLRLDVLPPSQLALWDEFDSTPSYFKLYGGTAIALQLGHRQSIDFDWFTFRPIDGEGLLQLPYLKKATVTMRAGNTLVCTVPKPDPVQVAFFGLPHMKRVASPIETSHGLHIAQLIDVAATKMLTVQKRAEVKDYIDIVAMLQALIDLSDMLGAAVAIYGSQFNPLLTLKALCYFDDPGFQAFGGDERDQLIEAVRKIDLNKLPSWHATRLSYD